MKERHALKLDLTHLFQPAMASGMPSLEIFDEAFKEIHLGVMALKKSGQLPFSKLPSDDILRDNVLVMARRYKDFDNVIVLGIGGSALGAASIYEAIKGRYHGLINREKSGSARLFVLDNIDPFAMNQVFDVIDGQKNLFVVISKSGNTSETLAQYRYVQHHFGERDSHRYFFITDPLEGCLKDLCDKNGHQGMAIPTGVGGRFSVFTAVGLLPLAVAGVDISLLLDGAAHAEEICKNSVLAQNHAALLALSYHHHINTNKKSQMVFMPYSDRLRLFSDWAAQLWGESLGKKDTVDGKEVFTGSTPIKSVGVTDQHSQLQLYLHGPRDKVVTFVEVEETKIPGFLGDQKYGDERIDFLKNKNISELLLTEKHATELALAECAVPNATIKMSEVNEFQIGQLYQLMMNVIPYMGVLMNINAFDQPAVERIKKFTFGLMGRTGYEEFQSLMPKSNTDKKFSTSNM